MTLSVRAHLERTHSGTVARIAQVLDHKTRMMGVELDVFHQDPCEIGPPTLRAGARNPGATPSQSSGLSASTSTPVWFQAQSRAGLSRAAPDAALLRRGQGCSGSSKNGHRRDSLPTFRRASQRPNWTLL